MARLLDWNRDFGVFFCTQGISNIGDAAWGVLIPLYVLQVTHNPLQVSAVAVVEVAANALLQFPLSALADRYESRRLMILADLGRMLLTLAVPLVSLLHGVSATDPLILGGTALVLFLVTLAANYIPARRAARLDPVLGLQTD